MTKYVGNHKTMTPTATADTTNLVDSTYPMALQGGASGQRNQILEVQLGGQATTSAPTFMMLARDSQVATGSLTLDANLSSEPLDGMAAAQTTPGIIFNKAATNKPQRDVNANLLNLSFNAFGGIVRWVAAPGEEIGMVGAAASFGETSLSAFTGGTAGLLGAHVVFETA